MTTLFNNFQQKSSGVTITTGNSAGNSTNTNNSPEAGANGDGSNAFDSVLTGTGSTCEYISTNAFTAHGETLCAEIATGSSSVQSAVAWTTSLGTVAVVYWRAYFYFTAKPSANIRIADVSATNAFSTGAFVRVVGTTGILEMVNCNGSVVLTTSTAAIPTGQWFRLEGMVNTTTGQVTISLYDTADSTTATETDSSSTGLSLGSNLAWAGFGNMSSAANVAAYYMADVAVSTSGYLGPSQYTGSPSGAVTLAASASGSRKQSGSPAAALTLAATASGSSRRTGAPQAALTLGTQVTGKRQQAKAATAGVALAAGATGASVRTGTPQAALTLATTAAGQVIIPAPVPATSAPSVALAHASAPSVTRKNTAVAAVSKPSASAPTVT